MNYLLSQIRKTVSILIVVGVFQGGRAVARDSCQTPSAPQDLRSFEDISYKKDLAMDIFLPSEGEHFPTAFIIHGGAWVQGNRKDFNPFAKKLTALGYAAITVSYRLANNANGRFPAPIEDLRCALKTLRKEKEKYSLDTDRILAIGNSAGAHLAAEIALTADSTQFSDFECPVRTMGTEVHSVIGYYGPYDLTQTDGLNLGQLSILSNFLGGLPIFLPKVAKLASPKWQIHEENIPFYLVHAANDDVVPVRSSREFTEALMTSNNPVQYVEVADGAHTLSYFDDRDFAREATCGTIRVLEDFAE